MLCPALGQNFCFRIYLDVNMIPTGLELGEFKAMFSTMVTIDLLKVTLGTPQLTHDRGLAESSGKWVVR